MRKPSAPLGSGLLAIAFLVLGATPGSAQYVPGPLSCGVSDGTIVPGQTITVTGSGFPANSLVTVTLAAAGHSSSTPDTSGTAAPGDIVLGTAQADDSGSFSKAFAVPATIEPGRYVCGCSGVFGETATAPVTVLSVVAPEPGTAYTGSSINVPLWVLLIAALLAFGVVFVALGNQLQTRAGRT